MKQRSLESTFTLLILVSSLPATIVAFYLAWEANFSKYFLVLVAIVQLLIIFSAIFHARHQLSFRLRGLATVLEAALQGDFSIKARVESSNSAFSDLVFSVNQLSSDLSQEKITVEEKRALLRKVLDQIQVGVITIGAHREILGVNPAARKILELESSARLKWLTDLPIALGAEGLKSHIVNLPLASGEKRVFIQQDRFRDAGEENQLILLTEVGHALRQEQFKSWEDLVRVISHEINNSLAPICSLGESITNIVHTSKVDSDVREALLESAEIISERAKSLTKFIAQYRNLSNIQQPDFSVVSMNSVVESILPLFDKQKLRFMSDKDFYCNLDTSQIQQVIINLIKNSFEAMASPSAVNGEGEVLLSLSSVFLQSKEFVGLSVEDSGCGIQNSKNLFVPFYSTKEGGSGIGLALSRQIIELHKGNLSLANKPSGKGCVATVLLPTGKEKE